MISVEISTCPFRFHCDFQGTFWVFLIVDDKAVAHPRSKPHHLTEKSH